MEIYNVLWTGGWDSTFRIIDLVLNKKKIVQPHYILDHKRKSTNAELQAMKKIKQMIFSLDSNAKNLILETKVKDIRDIPEDDEITRSYLNLATQSHLGSQYDWLARYVKHFNIQGLELCIHRDDKATVFISKDVKKITTEDDYYYVLKENTTIPELKIFSYFHFPLFELSKLDMEEIAINNGFKHIMEETWFCHNPTKDGLPCGLCNPCKYTREEGLGRRVPNPKLLTKLNHQIKVKLNRLTIQLKSKK